MNRTRFEDDAVTLLRIAAACLLLTVLLAWCGSVRAQTDDGLEIETTNTVEAAEHDAAEEDAEAAEEGEEDAAADEPPPPPSPFAREQSVAAQGELKGVWSVTIGDAMMVLTLLDDGTFTLNNRDGRYTRGPGQVTLSFNATHNEAARDVTYDYQFVNKQLQLTGGDLEAPLTFIRQFSLAIYVADMFNTNVDDILQRFKRIGFIIVIVVVAHAIIAVVRAVAYLLIFSEFGPLAMLYRERQNRARTIYSIVLNLVKYFIYFTALGMILAELGVNYMTYVASLSVIGLAVGFGSQGLVQDMVTGFFIIFEGQFDVGDMVEISGQSGYVIDLGLRMTKIRNYLGQTVVIPNRNIAMVGNYSRGAQRSYVDVQVPNDQAGTQAMPIMQKLGEDLLKQFEGVALPPLKVTGPWSTSTNETFVRLHLCIWPGQIWIVTEQIIPRLRDLLKRENVEITNDRITAYYHPVSQVTAPAWAGRLKWRRKRSKP